MGSAKGVRERVLVARGAPYRQKAGKSHAMAISRPRNFPSTKPAAIAKAVHMWSRTLV